MSAEKKGTKTKAKTAPASAKNVTRCPKQGQVSEAAAPKAPPSADQIRREATVRAVAQAKFLRTSAFPTYMAGALALDQHIEHAGYRCYFLMLQKDAGDAKDPIERMMIEQLALCHHRIGQLHADAANAKTVEAAKIYNAAAARLLAEFRRTALALRAYRTPANKKPSKKPLRIAKVS